MDDQQIVYKKLKENKYFQVLYNAFTFWDGSSYEGAIDIYSKIIVNNLEYFKYVKPYKCPEDEVLKLSEVTIDIDKVYKKFKDLLVMEARGISNQDLN